MSEVLETLLVLFKGDDSQFERTLRQVERESADTGSKVRKNLDFGEIGRNLTGLVGGGGILYGLREMAQESAKTDAAWRVLKATVGTSTEFSAAQRGISQVADTLKLTESQVVDSFTQMIRAGFGIDQISDLLISGGASALAFGRDAQAGLEGVASAAVTGQSIALNAIGIAENIGPELEKARKATAELSEEEQKAAQTAAFYGVITKATAGEVEVLGTVLEGLPGSQAAVNREFTEFRNTVGGIAQEALVPLNNALSGVLGFANDLPDPVVKIGTAMLGAGAGATALAAGVGTLSLVLGPLLGPAGLLILGAAAVAGFVVAANTAPRPVAQLETALDNLKTAQQEYTEAVRTGTEAETAAAENRLNIARNEAERALEQAQERLRIAQLEKKAAEDAVLVNPEAAQYSLGPADAALKAAEAKVAEAQKLLELSNTQLSNAGFDPLPLISSPTGTTTGTPVNTASASGSKDRTVADVFTDLNKEGTVAEQRAAALGNTLEAKLESLETRAKATDSALTEVFELGGSDAQVKYLVDRLAELNAQLEAVGEKPIDITAKASVLPERTILGQDEQDLDRGPKVTVQVAGEPVTILGTTYDPVTGEASSVNPARAQVDAEVQIVGEAYDPATGELIIKGPKVKVEVDNRRSQDPRGDIRESILAAQEFKGLLGDLQGFTGSDAELAGVRDRIQESYAAGDILLSQFQELLAIYQQLSGKELDLFDSRGYVPGTPKGGPAPVVPLLNYGSKSGGRDYDVDNSALVEVDRSRALTPGSSSVDELDSFTRAFDANNDLILDAGETFNKTIADAGLDFAGNVANALADGKITGNEAAGIGSALGAAGGFALGNLLLPGIGGELGKIAGGLLGGGIGGLLGGEDEADSRSRAAKDMERRGGVSSLNINVFANQTNQYDGSPSDPGVAQQFDRNLRRFIEETVKQMDLGKLQKQPA